MDTKVNNGDKQQPIDEEKTVWVKREKSFDKFSKGKEK